MQLAHDQQLKIIQACSQSRSLKEILFREWNMDVTVISALGFFLETSSTFRCLNLHDCAITPNELSVLLKSLAKNTKPRLEEFVLGGNPIGPIGLATIATYIRSGKINIKQLYLGFTGLDDGCADSLFEIINCNTQMVSLACGNNQLGYHTLKKIAAAMQNNNHLIKLDLHANAFHGNQRLAAVTDMSEVPQSSAQLLQQIDVKLSSNKQNQVSQNQDLLPKL